MFKTAHAPNKTRWNTITLRKRGNINNGYCSPFSLSALSFLRSHKTYEKNYSHNKSKKLRVFPELPSLLSHSKLRAAAGCTSETKLTYATQNVLQCWASAYTAFLTAINLYNSKPHSKKITIYVFSNMRYSRNMPSKQSKKGQYFSSWRQISSCCRISCWLFPTNNHREDLPQNELSTQMQFQIARNRESVPIEVWTASAELKFEDGTV